MIPTLVIKLFNICKTNAQYIDTNPQNIMIIIYRLNVNIDKIK